MKVSKIPGFGRFGVFIDDLKVEDLTDDLWQEIGQLHLKEMLTIIRGINFKDVKEYKKWMLKWGTPAYQFEYYLYKKYNINSRKELQSIAKDIKGFDKEILLGLSRISETDDVMRVSPKKDKDGNPLGMFAEGELLWHSNESTRLNFAPAVALLGQTGMTKSSTGFLQTVDWYEKQKDSFKKELDSVVMIHKFTPGKINPGLREEQDKLMKANMMEDDVNESEIPLVIKSPYGYKGLHFSINTIHSVKGLNEEESKKFIDYISSELFKDEYLYKHWYKNDNDLCLFDNSVCLHNREGSTDGRLAYRVQYHYDKLSKNYNPYLFEPYKNKYEENDKITKKYIKNNYADLHL